MLLVGGATLLGIGSLVGFKLFSFSLFMMVIYVWSKRSPGQQVSFYMFRVPAAYLPWVMVLFAFVMGDDITKDLMGIAAGHLYFFLQEELPGADTPLKGWRLMRTPDLMYRLFDVPPTHAPSGVMRMQQNAAQRAAGGAAGPAGRAHAWGQGNMLGR